MKLYLAVLAVVFAQTAPAPKLPTAEEILDRYIEVTGGKAAYEKLENRVATFEVAVPNTAVKMTYKVIHQSPEQMLLTIDVPGQLNVKQAFCDGIGWELSSKSGARLFTGEELDHTRHTAAFYPEFNWRSIYERVDTTGIEEMDGKRVYKTTAVTRHRVTETLYHEVESGLLVKISRKSPTPVGSVMVDMIRSDYRAVDGIRVPHKITQKMGPQQSTMNYIEIKHNVDLAADTFKAPPEVARLIEKAKKPADPPKK